MCIWASATNPQQIRHTFVIERSRRLFCQISAEAEHPWKILHFSSEFHSSESSEITMDCGPRELIVSGREAIQD